MNPQFRNRQLHAGNPLANILVVVVGIIVISLSLALGFVVFLGIASFMLIAAAIVSVRVWWLKRRLRGSPDNDASAASKPNTSIRIIEGEYREVRRPEDDAGDR